MTLIENGFQASNFTLKLYREMYVQFRLMYLYLQELQLTLIREFLGPSASVISGKKSKIRTGDVTVGTSKMKIICADTVSVELS